MRLSILTTILLGVGFCSLILSMTVKPLARAKEPWTDEQASAYEAATPPLPALSHPHHLNDHHDHSHDGDVENEELNAATRKYDRLRAELDAARARGSHAAWLLRWSGLSMIVAGIVVYFGGRQGSVSE